MNTTTITPDYEYLAEHAPAMHRQFEATLAAQAAFNRLQAAEARATNSGDLFCIDLQFTDPADADEEMAARMAHSAALRDLAAATLEASYQLLTSGLIR
jgi:hypothetical protein